MICPTDRAQTPDVHIVGEQIERVIKTSAGTQQQCKIARENCDILAPRTAEECNGHTRDRRALSGDRLDRDQSEIFDPAGDLGRCRGRNRAADDLAALASMRDTENSASHHRIVATRRTSAGDVMPALHFATPSSIMVVMPALMAALSMVVESDIRANQVTYVIGHLQNLENADPAAVTAASAPFTSIWLMHGFANLEVRVPHSADPPQDRPTVSFLWVLQRSQS